MDQNTSKYAYNASPDVDSPLSKLFIFGGIPTKPNMILYFDPSFGEFVERPAPPGLHLGWHMHALYSKPNEIFLSGGISLDYKVISRELSVYLPETNEFVQLPAMAQQRYAHLAIMWQGRYYVMGGRTEGDDNTALLNHVECFDFTDYEWKACPSMKKARTSAFSIIFTDQIYVFGGYTGPLKRSRLVERLNTEDNCWEIFQFRLESGIEAGLITSSPFRSSEFIIIGGCDDGGPKKQVIRYNFARGTAVREKNLCESRMLPKGLLTADKTLIILGGESSMFAETLDLRKGEATSESEGRRWVEFPVSLEQLHDITMFSRFTAAEPVVKLTEDIMSPIPQIGDQGERAYLFGTDEDQHILELSLDSPTPQITALPIPTNLRLLAYQGGVRLSQHKFFIAGGLALRGGQHVSKGAWTYTTRRGGRAKVLPKMSIGRYAFATLKCMDVIYVIGGRTKGIDDKSSILGSVEKYNRKEKKWEAGPPLNLPRVSPCSFVLKNRIFVAGGYIADLGVTNIIEMLCPEMNRPYWVLLPLLMREPTEAPSILVNDSENSVIIMGGKTFIESPSVTKLKFSDNMDNVSLIALPPLLRGGYLMKTAMYNSTTAIILGGHTPANFIQFYSVNEGRPVACSAKIEMQEAYLPHTNDTSIKEKMLL